MIKQLIFNMNDFFTFLSNSLREKTCVGSLFPSSKDLAQKMAAPMIQHSREKGKKILEVGAGIGGNISETLVRHLRPNDHLDLIEIEPSYCECLKRKYGHLPNVSIKCISVEKISRECSYDYIISSLPHSLFPKKLLVEILFTYRELLSDDGVFSGFSYFLPKVENPFSKWIHTHILRNKLQTEDIAQVSALLDQFFSEHQIKSTCVWRNLPPTRVYYLNFKDSRQKCKAALH